MIKHVGRIRTNKRKVIVAYRTLPNNALTCLCVSTESLEAADHDSLIKLVESNAAQTCNEFAEVMARATLSDGSNMLSRFHKTGKLLTFSTSDIEMTPDTNSSVLLSELNELIAQQKGVAIEDLAIKDDNEPAKPKQTKSEAEVVAPPTTSNDVLSDEQLAANYRSQADSMFKEAKRLREEAEKLHPTKKKKVTQNSDKEN